MHKRCHSCYWCQNGIFPPAARCLCQGMGRKKMCFSYTGLGGHLCRVRTPDQNQRQCGPQGSSSGNISCGIDCLSLLSPRSAKLAFPPALSYRVCVLCLHSLLCICTFHTAPWCPSSICRICTANLPQTLFWEYISSALFSLLNPVWFSLFSHLGISELFPYYICKFNFIFLLFKKRNLQRFLTLALKK